MFTLEALTQLMIYLQRESYRFADSINANHTQVATDLLDTHISDLHVIVADCHTLRDAFNSDYALFNHYDNTTRFFRSVTESICLICEQEHIDISLDFANRSIETLRETDEDTRDI